MKRLSCLTLLSLAFLTNSPAIAKDPDGGERKLEDTPKLTVRGEAELQKPADQLRISVGVVTENKEAGEALQENSTLMNDVIEAIESVGLSENEYETGRFRIRPQYSRRPRQPSPDWEPKITGYEVVNSVAIKTQQLDLIGDLIEAANKAGANTVEVTGFDLAEPRKYRAEAIAEAAKNALADARSLAEAASLELVRIVVINLDNVPNRMPEMSYARGRPMAADAGGSAPPITPGDVSVRATVTVVYEIAPK